MYFQDIQTRSEKLQHATYFKQGLHLKRLSDLEADVTDRKHHMLMCEWSISTQEDLAQMAYSQLPRC